MKTVTLAFAGSLLISPWELIHRVAIMYEFQSAVEEMRAHFSWLTLGVGVMLGVAMKLAYDHREKARYREFMAWMKRYEQRSKTRHRKK